MLSWKLCRMLSAIAAIGAMTDVVQAGCNCSVPPAPANYGPVPAAATGPGWSGDMSYGSYGMSPGGMAPGSMSATGYGTSPFGYAGMPNGAMNYAASPYSPGPNGIGDTAGPHWAPGGYEARIGSPVYYHDPAGGQYVTTGNPYNDHFGPGYHRGSIYGHYRFPYYTYRAPWYYPGRAVYNRDTNFPW